MNTLVLQPYSRRLDYTFFPGHSRRPADATSLAASMNDAGQVADALQRIVAACRGDRRGGVDLVAVRAAFGGAEFRGPAPVTQETLQKLRSLVPQDPLHLPALLVLLDCLAAALPGTPVVLVFETAFFAALPAREHLYGLDAQLAQGMNLRRYGYHGILHEAACLGCHGLTSSEDRALPQTGSTRKQRTEAAPRVAPLRTLSICLENQPEIAAVLGRRPVMVTSGATPLEGLPGQTTCGELDPGIVLMLAEKLHWGAEQINLALTRGSGWLGLTGERVGLDALFASDRPELQLAADVMRYRMLLACGAGVAAMGGVDRIVFSGRYAEVSASLGPWLQSKLSLACRHAKGQIVCQTFLEPPDRLIADAAKGAIRTKKARPRKALESAEA
jgi:acetate kinase